MYILSDMHFDLASVDGEQYGGFNFAGGNKKSRSVLNGFQEKYRIEFWTGQTKHSGTSAETTPDCFTDLSAVLLILKLKIFRTLSGIGWF